MTKMIVITGLDGSGKSTFLKKLETKYNSQLAILRLPTMEPEKFKDAPTLFKCCRMINKLGERGDNESIPGMKIIALFSAVVLFNELFEHLKKKNLKIIFCERHPLVDTLIYAAAYLKVMHPSQLSVKNAREIDQQYDVLLTEVATRLKVDFTVSKSSKSHSLLAFLYSWFSKKENLTPEKLYTLFEIEKPNEVYFLDAPTAILYSRIENRSKLEYHENIASLEKMRSNYQLLLPQFDSLLKIIDTSNEIAPTLLFEHFSYLYFK